jgi:hypothetical protein
MGLSQSRSPSRNQLCHTCGWSSLSHSLPNAIKAMRIDQELGRIDGTESEAALGIGFREQIPIVVPKDRVNTRAAQNSKAFGIW